MSKKLPGVHSGMSLNVTKESGDVTSFCFVGPGPNIIHSSICSVDKNLSVHNADEVFNC